MAASRFPMGGASVSGTVDAGVLLATIVVIGTFGCLALLIYCAFDSFGRDPWDDEEDDL